MPTPVSWLTFLVASLLFIQVPGPSLLFTIGRALTVGRRDALLSVVGNGLGLLAQVACVALGLGALVAASSTAYVAVKVLGATYVVWLGVQAIRHRADARLAMTGTGSAGGASQPAKALRIGFTVGVTNPKTLVFFTAFLPQFVNPDAGHASCSWCCSAPSSRCSPSPRTACGRCWRAGHARGSAGSPAASTTSPPPAAG